MYLPKNSILSKQNGQTPAYPMPRVDLIIDQLGGAFYITTMDLTRGYWQVPVAEDARRRSLQHRLDCISSIGCHLDSRVAPATFHARTDGSGYQRYLRSIHRRRNIFSESWEEHVSQIRAVLERLKGAVLTCSKCGFGLTACIYLGHVFGSGVVRPEASKVHAVLAFPIPVTKTHVRAFVEQLDTTGDSP